MAQEEKVGFELTHTEAATLRELTDQFLSDLSETQHRDKGLYDMIMSIQGMLEAFERIKGLNDRLEKVLDHFHGTNSGECALVKEQESA